MRIEHPTVTDVDGWARLASVVSVGDKRAEVYFEVPAEVASWLSGSSDAFLPAAAVFAPLLGERIVEVEGADPELVAGVRTVSRWLAAWYPDTFGNVPEFVISDPVASSARAGRAASLLSGGIDSLALIRSNHLDFPAHYPGRVAAGLHVDWNVDIAREGADERSRFFTRMAERLAAADLGVDVVLVRSNLTGLVPPRELRWGEATHGACFAGVAHALGTGLDVVRIASTYQLETLKPWGSHPFIDNELSSSGVRFVHDGLTMSRSEKAGLVASWPEAVEVASVCVGDYAARLERWNCGQCEKCVRTAASFVAGGSPKAARALIGRDLVPEDVTRLRLTNDVAASFWSDTATRADATGEGGLARAATALVRRYTMRRRLHRIAGPLGIRRVRARLRS